MPSLVLSHVEALGNDFSKRLMESVDKMKCFTYLAGVFIWKLEFFSHLREGIGLCTIHNRRDASSNRIKSLE